jgi:hypothetical protein
MTMKTMDQLAVELLLDDNQPLLSELAAKLKERMDIAMGNKCPLCGGSNVCVPIDSPEGVCHDCEEIYDAPSKLSVEVVRNRKGRIVELEWNE